LTIKWSEDLGKTWGNPVLLEHTEISGNESWTAYSDLVYLGNGQMGILYERDNYQEIVFKTLNFGGFN
jgi:sialidase-1